MDNLDKLARGETVPVTKLVITDETGKVVYRCARGTLTLQSRAKSPPQVDAQVNEKDPRGPVK